MAKKQKINMMKNSKVENEKICAILSYLLIGIIWYFVDEKMKQSSLAKYHARQGLVLFIAEIAYSIILSALLWPLLFGGMFMIYSLLRIVPLIFVIIGIINAANDKEKPLPLIGKFAEKFSF